MAENEMRPPALVTRNGLGNDRARQLDSFRNSAAHAAHQQRTSAPSILSIDGGARQTHTADRLGRRARFTPDHIVELAGRPGGFRVSARWRDQWLLRRCGRLVRTGRLQRVHAGEEDAFRFAAVAAEGAP